MVLPNASSTTTEAFRRSLLIARLVSRLAQALTHQAPGHNPVRLARPVVRENGALDAAVICLTPALRLLLKSPLSLRPRRRFLCLPASLECLLLVPVALALQVPITRSCVCGTCRKTGNGCNNCETGTSGCFLHHLPPSFVVSAANRTHDA